MSYTYPGADYPGRYGPTAVGKTRCQNCREEMMIGAAVCPKCRMYQGWRWWARLIGLNLPWYAALGTLIANYSATRKNEQRQALEEIIKTQELSAGVLLAVNSIENNRRYTDLVVRVENHLTRDVGVFARSFKITCGSSSTEIKVPYSLIITPGLNRAYPLHIERPSLSQKCSLVSNIVDSEGRSADTSPLEF